MKRAREDQSGAKRNVSQRPTVDSQGRPYLTTDDALAYLARVKKTYADRPEVYETFLACLKDFKANRIDTHQVISSVKKLFQSHNDLVLGFHMFLPRGHEVELCLSSSDDEVQEAKQNQKVQGAERSYQTFDQAMAFVNKIKKRFRSGERVYQDFLELLNVYRKGKKTIVEVYNEVGMLFSLHKDLLEEFTLFLPCEHATRDLWVRQAQALAGAGARPGNGKPPLAPATRGAAQPQVPSPDKRSQHKRKAAKEDLRPALADTNEDSNDSSQPALARELQYFEKVKMRLRGSKDAYGDMLRCMHLYNQEILSRGELISLVNDIIGKHQDLMAGFYDFLVKCETLDLDMSAVLGRAGTSAPMAAAQREALRHKGLLRDKSLTRPLSEIVAGEAERVTPSYARIPPDYPKLVCSGRTQLGAQVLNDTFVNVISGSEDYSFKLMRKNQYEEALFRCEDDRYDLDMCMERNAAAIKALRPLADKMQALSEEQRAAHTLEPGALSLVTCKAVETLYADQGQLMVELLRAHPGQAVAVVLARMEQKQAEWGKVRAEMGALWEKIFQVNYHKSLDHRSFYFKQAEKKQLLPKSMVQELKEAAEARRRLEETLPRACSPLPQRYMAPVKPDVTLEYADRRVFEDCWTVLRTAIAATLGPGPREQLLNLYLSLVEPLFCLPVRTEELARVQAAQQQQQLQGKSANGVEVAGTSAAPAKGRKGRARSAASPSPAPESGETGAEGSGADTGLDDARGLSGPWPPGGLQGNLAMGVEGQGKHGVSYAGCRPLAPWMIRSTPASAPASPGAAAAAVPAAGVPSSSGTASTALANGVSDAPSTAGSSSAPSRLLLANELMYVFLRYHRHLYERLKTARRCVVQQAQARAQQVQRDQAQRTGRAQGKGLQGSAAAPGTSEAPLSEEEDKLHGTFMTLAQRLLSGDLEISAFEDQVRTLLGANSYELFTLDKLVQRLVNHLRMMIQDGQTVSLWEVHQYENARSSGVNPLMYQLSSSVFLDDVAYRIEYRDSSNELLLTLVDLDTKAPYNSKNHGMAASNAYIRHYVTATAGQLQSNIGGRVVGASAEEIDLPYLQRNLAACKAAVQQQQQEREGGEASGGGGDGDPDCEVAAALRLMVVRNGLDCKVACSNSKLSYVMDTQDFICRRTRKVRQTSSPSKYKQARQARMLQWLGEEVKRLGLDLEGSGGSAEAAPGSGAAAGSGAAPMAMG